MCGEMKSAGTLPHRVGVRSNKYLNNMIEQDHRRIKQRIRPMLGFKRFDTAAITITGIGVGREDQKASVQERKAGRKTEDGVRDLIGRACRVKRTRKTLHQSHLVYIATSVPQLRNVDVMGYEVPAHQ